MYAAVYKVIKFIKKRRVILNFKNFTNLTNFINFKKYANYH